MPMECVLVDTSQRRTILDEMKSTIHHGWKSQLPKGGERLAESRRVERSLVGGNFATGQRQKMTLKLKMNNKSETPLQSPGHGEPEGSELCRGSIPGHHR